jgi:hypothetical protein
MRNRERERERERERRKREREKEREVYFEDIVVIHFSHISQDMKNLISEHRSIFVLMNTTDNQSVLF